MGQALGSTLLGIGEPIEQWQVEPEIEEPFGSVRAQSIGQRTVGGSPSTSIVGLLQTGCRADQNQVTGRVGPVEKLLGAATVLLIAMPVHAKSGNASRLARQAG